MDTKKLKQFIAAIAVQALIWLLILPFTMGDFFEWPYSRFGIMAMTFVFMNYISVYGHRVKNYCIALPFFYVITTIILFIEKGFVFRVVLMSTLFSIVICIMIYFITALEKKVINRFGKKTKEN